MIRMQILHCLPGMTATTRLALLRRTCEHDPYEFYRIDGPGREPKPEHLGLTIGEMRTRRPDSLPAPVTYLVPEAVAEDLLALAPDNIRLGASLVLGSPEDADPPSTTSPSRPPVLA